MKLNDGYENATTLDELRTYVEYSGNEAEILKSYYGHRKCKSRFRYSFSTRMTELPQQFYDEWNGKIKSFKELYFGKYLTQEFFEKDPSGAVYLCRHWYKNDDEFHENLSYRNDAHLIFENAHKFKRMQRRCSRINSYNQVFG